VLLDATTSPLSGRGAERRPPSGKGDAPAALAAYARDGFLVVPGLLAAAECAELRDAAVTLAPEPSGPRAPVMNPHVAHPAFLRVLRHPGIIEILEVLLASLVSGLQSQYFPCVPGTPGFRTHQDNHYVEAARDAFASAWAALDDAHAGNGALVVYPGSHREPLLPVAALPAARPHETQAFNALRQEVAVPPGYAARTVTVQLGTVVFLHGHLLHGSHDNHSSGSRRALLNTYIRRGAVFRRGRSAQRVAIDVYGSGGAR
jgi:ectoine hydroxylase-related dioxygenase (phytanoyl-CoA dioxygenase family)